MKRTDTGTRWRAASLAPFLFLLAAAGCGADETPPPGELPLILGTGEAVFVPLVDGQEVDLVKGSQGGHHVWVAVRSEGVAEGRVFLRVTYEPADGSGPPVPSEVPIFMDRDEVTGEAELVGWPAVIADPGCVVDTMIHLQVEIEDQRGARGADERTILVRGGDNPPDPC